MSTRHPAPAALAVPEWLHHSPATYSAWVAGVALIVTVIAVVLALLQLRNAVRVRREQARPSVVAYDEVSPRSDFAIELVIKNFGTTVANNVHLTSSPPLQRAANMTPDNTDVPVPVIPTLAPGQEWRTVWDWTLTRLSADPQHGLPDRHEVTVSFDDTHGKTYSSDSVLDFAAYRGRRHLGTKTLSDLAKSVAEIEKHLKSFRESSGNHAGINVWVRDGAAKDAEERAWFEQPDTTEETEQADVAASWTSEHPSKDSAQTRPGDEAA